MRVFLISLLTAALSGALAQPQSQASLSHLSNHQTASKAFPNHIENLLDDHFDAWFSRVRDEWGMRGIHIAVVRQLESGGWATQAKGYGVANEAGDPVTSDTIFAIASNSKLFTVLALGKLIENPHNNLKWSTKISSILGEDWQLQDRVAQQEATLQDLVSHRTGLPRHEFAYHRSGQTPTDILKLLRYLRPSAGLREHFQYSNVMYMVAQLVIERISGMSFEDFVTEKIIRRLFSSTTYNSTWATETGNMADVFGLAQLNASSRGEGWSNSIHQPFPLVLQGDLQHFIAGAGGVLMNGHDAVTWLQTLLSEGLNPKTGERVISKASIRHAAFGVIPELSMPEFPELSTPIYGAGQWQYSYKGHNLVEHDGGLRGWKSVISRSPDDGMGIAIFTNWEQGAFVMYMIKWYLYERAFDLPHIDWSARYRAIIEPTIPPALEDKRPGVDTKKYAGVYTNPGYGTLVLCSTEDISHLTSHGASNCSTALAQAKIVASKKLPNVLSPDLVAVIHGRMFNHLQLVHMIGHTFKSSHFEVTQEPVSRSNVVFPGYDLDFDSEFVLDEEGHVRGIAWTGNIWRAGPEVEPASGRNVEESAEVYWERYE